MNQSSGKFFRREISDPNSKQPHFAGEIDLSPELIAQIAAQPGGFRLRVVGWEKQGNRGPWISLSAQADQIQPGHPNYRPPYQGRGQGKQDPVNRGAPQTGYNRPNYQAPQTAQPRQTAFPQRQMQPRQNTPNLRQGQTGQGYPFNDDPPWKE